MKKLMALLMALMMLALPLAGLAEGDSFVAEAAAAGRRVERTTTFQAAQTLTGVPEVDQLIGELLAAISVKTYTQGVDATQSGLTVNLNGKDVLTVQFAVEDKTLYVQSDLLAGNTLAVSHDESEAAAEKIAGLLASAAGVRDSEAAELRQELAILFKMLTDPESVQAGPDIDFEKMIADFEAAGSPDLEKFAEQLSGRMKEVDLSGKPAASDPATRALSMELTAEDIVAVYEMSFEMIKGNEEYMKLLNSIAEAGGEDMTGEGLYDELLETLRTEIPNVMKEPATVIYYVDADDALVAVTLEAKLESDGEAVNMSGVLIRVTEQAGTMYNGGIRMYDDSGKNEINLTLNSLLTDGGVQGEFGLDVAENGSSVASESVSFAYNTLLDTDTAKSASGSFGMQISSEGETIAFGVDFQTESAKVGADAQSHTVITLNVAGVDMVTVTSDAVTADPVASLATGGALHPAQMSDEDLHAFTVDLTNNLQLWLIELIQSLPTSVLMNLMNN